VKENEIRYILVIPSKMHNDQNCISIYNIMEPVHEREM